MGGVWAGGPGPDLSQSLAFLARGQSPESGVRALLPLVVVVVAPLVLGLRLGLIDLWTSPGVLLPLWLSRFASLVILVLGSLALAVPRPVVTAKRR